MSERGSDSSAGHKQASNAAAASLRDATKDDSHLTAVKSAHQGTVAGCVQAVFALLGEIELGGQSPAPGWPPQFTGLERVSCDLGVAGGCVCVLAEYRVRRVCGGRAGGCGGCARRR